MSLFSTISNKAADLTQRVLGALPSYSKQLAGIAATLLAFNAGTANAQQPRPAANTNSNNTDQTAAAAKKDAIATHSNLTPREIYNSLDRYLKQNTNLSTAKRFEVIEGFFKINTDSDIYLHMSKARIDQPMVVLKSEQKLRPEQVGYTQDSIKKFYGVDFGALNTTIATAQTAKKETVAAAAEKAKVFTNQDFINVADAYFKKTTVGLSENQRMARIDRTLKALNGETAHVEEIDGQDGTKEFVLASDSTRTKKLGADATAILALVKAKIATAKQAATATGNFIDPNGPIPPLPGTTKHLPASPAQAKPPVAKPVPAQKPSPTLPARPATATTAETATAKTYNKLLAEARTKKPANDADLFASMRKAAADTHKTELLSLILNSSKTIEAGKALPTLSQLTNRQVITAVFRFGESLGYKAQSAELGALADKILRQEFKKDLASLCLNRDALFGTKTSATTAKATPARTSQAARPVAQTSKPATIKKPTTVATSKPYEIEVRARQISDPITLSTTRLLEEVHQDGKVIPIAAETVFQKRIPIISAITGMGLNYKKVTQTQDGYRESRFLVPVRREGKIGSGIKRLKQAFDFRSQTY